LVASNVLTVEKYAGEKEHCGEISNTNMAVLATKLIILNYLVFLPTSAETGRGCT
jgi:hypothetical protein